MASPSSHVAALTDPLTSHATSSKLKSRHFPMRLTRITEPQVRDADSLTRPTSSRGRPRPKSTTPKSDESSPVSRPGSKKGKESAKEGIRQRAEMDAAREERSREDAALAKWRKWVVEQPIQATAPSTSPIRSARSGSIGGQKTPLISINSSFLRSNTSPGRQHQGTYSPKNGLPRLNSVTEGSISPSYRHSAINLDSHNVSSPLHVYSSRMEPSKEIFNTESVLALRDVELAVDPSMLERAERTKGLSRRVSNRPRLDESANPFLDIIGRLGSRRIRPILLELIQALGHFIDAVWSMEFPHRSCPWIIGVEDTPVQRSIRRMMLAGATQTNGTQPIESGWKSPMITVVQEGKRSGFVPFPSTEQDIKFWEDEVTYAIEDVNEIAGVQKGSGKVFANALQIGQYGPIDRTNAVGTKGEGGGVARLLNDLEEAIWGDAPPRPTDLAYELPADFDIYAFFDESDIMSSSAGVEESNPIRDFFNRTSVKSQIATMAGSSDTTYDSLPDFEVPSTMDEKGASNANETRPSNVFASRKRNKNEGAMLIPGIENIQDAESMTLEELGRKRHEEWLSKRSGRRDSTIV